MSFSPATPHHHSLSTLPDTTQGMLPDMSRLPLAAASSGRGWVMGCNGQCLVIGNLYQQKGRNPFVHRPSGGFRYPHNWFLDAVTSFGCTLAPALVTCYPWCMPHPHDYGYKDLFSHPQFLNRCLTNSKIVSTLLCNYLKNLRCSAQLRH